MPCSQHTVIRNADGGGIRGFDSFTPQKLYQSGIFANELSLYSATGSSCR